MAMKYFKKAVKTKPSKPLYVLPKMSIFARGSIAAVIIILTVFLAFGIRNLVLAKDRKIVAAVHRENRDEEQHIQKKGVLTRIIAAAAFWAILVLGLLITMQLVGLRTTGIVAMLTALGFTIGLAMQGVLGDFLSGVLIATFGMYQIGDVIQVGDTVGTVVDFRMLHTIVREFHTYAYTTIPNNTVYNNITKNITLTNNQFVHVDVKLSHRADTNATHLADIAFIRKIILDDLLDPEKREYYQDVAFDRINMDVLKEYKENSKGGVDVVVYDMSQFGTDVRIVYPVIKNSAFPAQMRLNTRVRQILFDHKVDLAYQG